MAPFVQKYLLFSHYLLPTTPSDANDGKKIGVTRLVRGRPQHDVSGVLAAELDFVASRQLICVLVYTTLPPSSF